MTIASEQVVSKDSFVVGEHVVYPCYGVGEITGMEEQEVLGCKLELFTIEFSSKRMLLRVPVSKVAQTGMRRLSSPDLLSKAMEIVKSRPRVKRAMWARRAQEYESKINSGSLVLIAEVVRDLHKIGNPADQSYSERQLYEIALERMASEFAVVNGFSRDHATSHIEAAMRGTASTVCLPKPVLSEGRVAESVSDHGVTDFEFSNDESQESVENREEAA